MIKKNLVIVESPAKCKKIEDYLNSSNNDNNVNVKYQCIASYGHLRELPDLKHIDIPAGYIPSFTVIDNSLKKKQIGIIKRQIEIVYENEGEVILATDDDREGEAIAWHICQLFHLPIHKTKRIIFHEITAHAIQYAINHPTFINMNIVKAQQSRQMLDLLVGFKISPMLWKYISSSGSGSGSGPPTPTNSLSAGRCQTPALRIVYDNQKEIDGNALTSHKIYHITGFFTNFNLPFDLSQDIQSENMVRRFLETTANPANIPKHTYYCSVPLRGLRTPPRPFSTSGLQQCASNELHYGVKETMRICQSLYEKGLITYMRTDSQKYSPVFIESTKKMIVKKWGANYLYPNFGVLIANGATPHEAIRPTNIELTDLVVDTKTTPGERRMYKLIWENTVASCMANATVDVITAKIKAVDVDGEDVDGEDNNNNNEEVYDEYYVYKCEKIIFAGWKIVKGSKNAGDAHNYYEYLQNIKNGTVLAYKKIEAIQSMETTGKHLHMTEAKLVKELEERGIGRPSTFAMLVDKIQERGYVTKIDIPPKQATFTDYILSPRPVPNTGHIQTKVEERQYGGEKNKLVIQSIGITVCEFLEKHFGSLLNYKYTKYMEDFLDQIAEGEKESSLLCSECDTQIHKCIETLNNDDSAKKISVKIDVEHTFVIGRNGPVIKYKAIIPKEKKTKERKTKTKTLEQKQDNQDNVSPSLEKTKTKNPTILKSVKKDIEINNDFFERLKNGEYTLNDLLEPEKTEEQKLAEQINPSINDTNMSRFLGFYEPDADADADADNSDSDSDDNEGEKQTENKKQNNKLPVYVKKGKFGLYLSIGEYFGSSLKTKKTTKENKIDEKENNETKETNEKNDDVNEPIQISLCKFGNRPLETIQWKDIEHLLTTESKILREINTNMSIRKGPKTNYIFFKTAKMKKPKFCKLAGFKGGDPVTCELSILTDWIKEKYGLF